MRPPFIVIEGPDGAGKSTQVALLGQRLLLEGVGCALVCEPTTDPLGQWARKEGASVPWSVAAMVFAADRAVHGLRTIRPLREAGDWVVCDRYALSSMVYSLARARSEDWSLASADALSVLTFVAALERDREPESLNIVLEVPPEEAANRRESRGAQSAYDRAKWADLIPGLYSAVQRMAAGIIHLPCVAMDGVGSQQQVADRIWQHVAPMAQQWKTNKRGGAR